MDANVVEYFFGRTIKPKETSTVALMFREVVITNVACKTVPKKNCIVKGTVMDDTFVIACLTPQKPQQCVRFNFVKDCNLVTFENTGDVEIDITGYITGLDGTKLMSLKKAMELSDDSNDEDYKEDEEEEEEEEKEEEEEEKEMEEEEEKEEEEKEMDKKEEEEENRDAVDFNTPGFKFIGKFVRVKDIVIGTGNTPVNGHNVEISYRLTLPNGEVLDSDKIEDSTRIPFPTQFRVGLGHVVRGMDRALITMRVGGTRQVLIRPEMGFGDKGNIMSGIGPDEVFMIEITLLGAK